MVGKKLAIVTCCLDDWGGSEELWARSIDYFQQKGNLSITIYKNQINRDHPEFKKLSANNILLRELLPNLKFSKKLAVKASNILYRIADKAGILEYQWNKPVQMLYKQLKSDRPDLVLISQGINFDGLAFANECLKLNIPYVIVSHKAVEFYWPQSSDRSYMKEVLQKAVMCFFVSEHNRKLTEEQFGLKLINSDIVINPIKPGLTPLPYPPTIPEFRLACIGRLFVIDKGQDMLIRMLAMPKWKERNIKVSFFGTGPDREALGEMATMLQLKNVTFPGHTGELNEIWSNHHALILPSRSEGLPLTLIEAMCMGRMAIVSNAGGNAEIVQHGTTGYVAQANEKDLDEVMELAWQHRDSWESMGKKATEYINATIPHHPEKKFANYIIDLLHE